MKSRPTLSVLLATTMLPALVALPTASATAPAVQVARTAAAAEPPSFAATPLRSYPAFDANQAVAVERSTSTR